MASCSGVQVPSGWAFTSAPNSSKTSAIAGKHQVGMRIDESGDHRAPAPGDNRGIRFQRQLAPGVGLAENDPRGESFGSRRCALLADGIIRAHEQGTVRDSDRVEAVAERFAEDGVLIDAPYLDPSLAGRHVL